MNATLNAVTSTTYRYNNTNDSNRARTRATNLTDGTHCYAYEDGSVSGVVYAAGDVAPCNSALTSGTFGDPTRSGACPDRRGGGGAAWKVSNAGDSGFVNAVQPVFTSASISDVYRPNNRLTIECYANSGDGTADPACGKTSIRNPYYGQPPQPLFARGAW